MKSKSIIAAMLLLACGYVQAEQKVAGKWYTLSQVEMGRGVYAGNCVACHGAQGQGLADDWKQPLADGSYPPPPLNGSAHTWHHPISILLRTINNGGAPLGGKMPAFKSKLSNQQKIAVVAFF